jgi:hypothetical protein
MIEFAARSESHCMWLRVKTHCCIDVTAKVEGYNTFLSNIEGVVAGLRVQYIAEGIAALTCRKWDRLFVCIHGKICGYCIHRYKDQILGVKKKWQRHRQKWFWEWMIGNWCTCHVFIRWDSVQP